MAEDKNDKKGVDEAALREEFLRREKDTRSWSDRNIPTFKRVGSAAAGFAAANANRKARSASVPSSDIDGLKLMGWVAFILSLMLYYFIDWQYRYNGIDIGFFTDLSNADWLFKSGVLTIFLLLLVFQIFLAKPSNSNEFKAAIFADMVLAIMFVLSRYSAAALFHLIFAVIIWFVFTRQTRDQASAYNTLTILILLDFLGFSALKYLFEFTGMAGGIVVISAMIFPIYSLYLLHFLEVYGKSKLATFCLMIILILYIFGFVQSSDQYKDITSRLDAEDVESAKTFWKTAGERMSIFGSVLGDPLACIGKVGSDEYDDCLKERQYERECRDKKKNLAEYQKCIEGKKLGEAQGASDSAVKDFTKVTFEHTDQFPKLVQKEFKIPIPMQLNIESPKKEISIILSCKFQKDKENITGIVEQSSLDKIIGNKKETVLCSMPSDKEFTPGKYKVIFEAEIKGMETISRLQRLFVKNDISEERKSELLSLHSLSSSEPSKSPDEFAAFSFGVGTPSTTPFIDENPTQALVGNVENRAEGKLINIQEILIELVPGISPRESCLVSFEQRDNILAAKKEVLQSIKGLSKKGDKRFLIGCNLDISPAVIPSEFEEYYKREFISNMRYSYKIEKEGIFEVK